MESRRPPYPKWLAHGFHFSALATPFHKGSEPRPISHAFVRAGNRPYVLMYTEKLERFEPLHDADGGTRHYVVFDLHRRKKIRGLRLGSLNELQLPDERIQDRVLEFAKAVWHLKDRLHQFAKATGQQVDVNGIGHQSANLLVASDPPNKKKHGRHQNGSKLNPHLDLVRFDTSRSGPIELYYDSAMKDKELIVTNPVPIPFTVDILIQDGNSVLGDAREVINHAFHDWLPAIQQLGVLSPADPEAGALRSILFGPTDANSE